MTSNAVRRVEQTSLARSRSCILVVESVTVDVERFGYAWRMLPQAPFGAPQGGEPPLFRLREVCLERGSRSVLRDVTLELPRGRVVGIIGPSGAGKTSLLRLLNRLDDPTGGAIDFSGAPLMQWGVPALRRKVAFVFQSPALFPGSVADNLQTAVELGGARAAAQAPDPATVLEAVGLESTDARRDVAVLSGGEQQRVGIARALMTRPEVLLLDEPTSALDPETAHRLLTTVTRLSHEQQLSVIMVTHRLGEARQFTSHSVMLEAGRVVAACSTTDFFAGATTERARAYRASYQ
jgi:ABC-type methionine transport system ATPase subunit